MDAPPCRLLIVDDSPEDRQLYRRQLSKGEELAFRFREAGSGEEGLLLCAAEAPDCILLDYHLPDLDGVEFLVQLRAQPGAEMTAVVILTGQGNEEIAVRAMKAGAEDYLVKGRITSDGLRQTVRTSVEKATLRRQIEQQQLELERIQADFFRHLVFVQEEERHRIARDLHDGIGQSIWSLLVGLQGLRALPALEPARGPLDELLRQTTLTLDEVRRLSRQLRPLVLDELGLNAALERDAADFSQAHGIVVKLYVRNLHRLPGEIETATYRIVQEALTNIARHAAARKVSIVVERKAGFLEAIVEDDGRGFDSEAVLRSPVPGRHFGLCSMRERAALLGGAVTIDTAPGNGTLIRVQLPLPEKPHGEDSAPHR